MEFKSRGVRSLVELHEIELQNFLKTWERFIKSGAPLPDPLGDPDYKDKEHIVGHVLTAARAYLVWIGEQLGRPITDIDMEKDRYKIASDIQGFAQSLLSAWRRHLVSVADEECGPKTYKTRWGDNYTIENMLEHAVVHPMRHRIQLERILSDLV
ncbi:MAG: hypothetical protein HY606_02765 [Planctomycetes bacterium]|nr:hypothetical protein [Planctomycetota bacterium]